MSDLHVTRFSAKTTSGRASYLGTRFAPVLNLTAGNLRKIAAQSRLVEFGHDFGKVVGALVEFSD
jgi:hypothetical protein